VRTAIGSTIRTVGIRLIVLGGAALLGLIIIGDLPSLIPSRAVRQRTADSPEHVAASDPGWPHRRGPHYSAVSDETDLADSWPPRGPPVLWTRDLGRGYSGFTAVGDRIFTQAQSLSSQFVLCMDADTGEPIWEHRYDWPYDAASMYPGPRATPTWHDGRVFFAGPRGLLGCLNAGDGELIWKVNVNEKFGGRGTDFGYSCSPTIIDGKVIMPVGGEGAAVVALDARDGSTVWTSGNEPASYCSAIPISVAGRFYAVAFLQNALAVFDVETGRLAWQAKYSQGYDEHAAAPLYEEPHLMIACPFKSGSQCYRLTAGAADPTRLDVTTVWMSRYMSNDTASSVVLEGLVYGFDLKDVQAKAHRPSRGKFKCMELATGRVLWESDRPGHATLVVADGKLILFNDRGELLTARATGAGYEELARSEIFAGEICWTAPALHRGRLYLRSPSKAACVYVGRPEELGSQRLRHSRPASEIPKSRRIDLSRLVGGERQYAFDPADAAELGLWYWFGLLGVLVPAAILAFLAHLLTRIRRGPTLTSADLGCHCRQVFWIAAFAFGVLGTPVYNRIWPQFIFTWPVCLFVAHQVTLNVIVRAAREDKRGKHKWLSLLMVSSFLLVCILYFLACRRLSMAIEWIFLMGFLPSWPIAVPAAYQLRRNRHLVWDVLWATLSYSLYFWVAGGLMLWKTAAM